MPAVTITALYRFVALDGLTGLQAELRVFCIERGIKGTLLLAPEGINGTVAGSGEAVGALLDRLQSDPRFAGLEHKESFAEANPFARMKVRLKKEIVTLGVAGVEPNRKVGTYVEPAKWNELISRPDTIVIDTRNDYETAIGTFANAIDPGTTNFRDFPAWFDRNRERFGNAPKFAMFCTGGIRCEKATAWLRQQGYDEVYHLKGGILKYLQEVPEEKSLWQGECFVFDDRVSVGHGLKPGPFDLCHACRMPISPEDRASPLFVPEVSCPQCHGRIAEKKKAALAERRKQVDLARVRGERHVAADLAAAKARKRAARVKAISSKPSHRSHRG
jgi:UPF0176 protein